MAHEQVLIACFAVEPILFGGERKVDCMVDLAPEQLRGFKTLKPCPVREVQQAPAKQEDSGTPPEPTAAEPTAEPAPVAQASEPEPAPEAKTEMPAQTQAKARAKAAKS
jgi:hypothetical protein